MVSVQCHYTVAAVVGATASGFSGLGLKVLLFGPATVNGYQVTNFMNSILSSTRSTTKGVRGVWYSSLRSPPHLALATSAGVVKGTL